MNGSTGKQPRGDANPHTHLSAPQVWVISADLTLTARIEEVLQPLTEEVIKLAPQPMHQETFWTDKPPCPALIVLDIDRDIELGLEIIKSVKRARIRAPMVVLTRDFSRKFGAKIISEGIRYYFPYDFCQHEFLQVAESLLKIKAHP